MTPELQMSQRKWVYTAAAEHEERNTRSSRPTIRFDLPPPPIPANSLPFDGDLSVITSRAQQGLNEAFIADLPFVAAAVKARDQGVLENRALNMGRAMAESLARLGAFPNWLPPRRLAPSPSQA